MNPKEILLPSSEVFGKRFTDGLVEIPATDSATGVGEHGQLSLIEAAGRHLSARVTDVYEDDVSRRFVGLGEVLLVDAVGQGGGRSLVHQLQHVQAGNPANSNG
mgnify:FL=1